MDSAQISNSNALRMAASTTVASALAPKKASVSGGSAATTTPSTSTTASDPSDITASDFLTLLVSELQNQDPTQPTDPNAYITQLVGVNSLQQLISIDNGITGLNTAVTTPTTSPTNPTGQTSGVTPSPFSS